MNNKKVQSVIAVYGIVALIYILAFLIIPFDKNGASVIAFVFTLISLAVSLKAVTYVFGKDDSLKSKFYGFPVIKIAYMYPLVQGAFSVLIWILAAVFDVSYWIALLPSLVIMGTAAIALVAIDNARDFVQKEDEKTENILKTSKLFHLNAQTLVDVCTETNVKAELKKLQEAIRFSDPVSCGQTEQIEQIILEKLENLKINLHSASAEENIASIIAIRNLLSERNALCKMYK